MASWDRREQRAKGNHFLKIVDTELEKHTGSREWTAELSLTFENLLLVECAGMCPPALGNLVPVPSFTQQDPWRTVLAKAWEGVLTASF